MSLAMAVTSDEHEAVVAALEGQPVDLLDQDVLLDRIEQNGDGIIESWLLKRILHELGWKFLGRFNVGGKRRRLWSQPAKLSR